jgi:hypothetical protein
MLEHHVASARLANVRCHRQPLPPPGFRSASRAGRPDCIERLVCTRHACPLMVSRAVPHKPQEAASVLRVGSITTSADAMAPGFRLIAAAILAPTASLAARSGSADR